MTKEEMIILLSEASGEESLREDEREAIRAAADRFSEECPGDDAQAVIGMIMAKEKVNQQQLADKIGMTRQSINQSLTRGKSMRYPSFQRMVDVLGYEVICRKKLG